MISSGDGLPLALTAEAKQRELSCRSPGAPKTKKNKPQRHKACPEPTEGSDKAERNWELGPFGSAQGKTRNPELFPNHQSTICNLQFSLSFARCARKRKTAKAQSTPRKTETGNQNLVPD